MKMLLPVFGLFASLNSNATVAPNYDIQKFPGKITIEADIGFTTPSASALDVLFVVDNSGSMQTYQRILSSATTIIDSALSHMNRDFHLGVISTDVDTYPGARQIPGALLGSPTVVTAKDLPGALARNLLVGTNGSANESPFAAVQLALSEPNLSTNNKGFLRPGAALALVFLTDAEDQSQQTANDLKNFLATTKGDLNRVTAFSWIVPTVSTAGCERDDYEATPKKIEELTQSLNGVIYNVCNMYQPTIGDFAQRLAVFGIDNTPTEPVADFSEVPLTTAPVVSSIEVRYGSQTITAGDLSEGWVYDAAKNAVILGSKITWSQQPAGTKLTVSFVPADWAK